jgi:ribosome recycling factor
MEDADTKTLLVDTKTRMSGTIEYAKRDLASVRTGRASVSIIDSIQVDAYDTKMPLNQMASLSIPEPTLIVAQPFDPSLLNTIEKAIQSANLGLNPNNDGKVVRIPIPSLTDERRKELSRQVHKLIEESRNTIRRVRRDTNDKLKKLLKSNEISEDNEQRTSDDVQKITDRHIHILDDLQKKKDNELLTH